MIHLILGGARSGKSSFAENWCLKTAASHQVTSLNYVATAIPFDAEMTTRITHHQQSRDKQWHLVECPLTLAQEIAQWSNGIYLVDCLTLWLNNVIYSLPKTLTTKAKAQQVNQQVDALTKELSSASLRGVTIALVSNEVGLGVIPMGEETRLFVDHAGWLNQAIAQTANNVTLVTAGIPMAIKGDLNG